MSPAEEKVAFETVSTSSVWPLMIVSRTASAREKNCGESLSETTSMAVTLPPLTVAETVVVPL